MGTIIAGFPGVGKSYLSQNDKHTRRVEEYRFLDSDSSRFSWLANNPKVRDPAFPENYINHIKSIVREFDFVFVSTHKSVLEGLSLLRLPFTVVYPDRALKYVYSKRYIDRGNDDLFIDMMLKKWDNFISDIEQLRPMHYGERPHLSFIQLYSPEQYLTIEHCLFAKAQGEQYE